MAISVSGPTGIIFVPKTDTVLVGTDPVTGREIRTYDTIQFWKELRDWGDNEEGRPFPNPVNSNPPDGILVRTVTVTEYYFIEFEEDLIDPYRVVLEGSNNNLDERAIINGTSTRSTNSAGLVSGGGGLTPGESVILSTINTLVEELHRLQGLNAASPMTVTPTLRTAGDITQEITGDGLTTSTVTRKP